MAELLAATPAGSALAGPVRVVAGAGTGKTALLVSRVAELVTEGADPASILVMTFTERAAHEMAWRLQQALGGAESRPLVGTFHAVAQSWLREDGWRIGIPRGFDVLAGVDRWILVRELMWELAAEPLVTAERPDEQVGALIKMLERLKQELVPTTRLRSWALEAPDREAAPILEAAADLFDAYARRCSERRLLDFEDLISGAVRLLELPELRAVYSDRYRWLLVDEYQDTNLAQERLVEMLAEKRRNVFVVGDDDQSIYRFRGASRASMERFARRFVESVTLEMGRNLRSSGNIVAAARTLIEQNRDRLTKQLEAAEPPGSPVAITSFPSGRSEASAIAEGIAERVLDGVPASRIAVLVRTNAVARAIVDALRRRSLPHRVWGAAGLYQVPEVKDVIAWLRAIATPADAVAEFRLRARPDTGYTPLLREELAGLVPALGVRDLLFEVLNRTRYLESFGSGALESAQAMANVARFAELVDSYCERVSDQSLRRYLEYLDLVLLSELDEDLPSPEGEASEAVQVMTIHRAKGLEFDIVYVPSLVEGRLPQPVRRSGLDLPVELAEPAVRGREDHVAEERRLLYVAMTRARHELHLSWAQRYEGGRGWRPSRFLAELEAAPEGAVQWRQASGDSAQDVQGATPRRGSAASAKVDLSYSAISSFRECPLQFKYRYVDELPAVPSLEAEYGTLIHAVLMEAGRRRQRGEEVTPGMLAVIEAECGQALPGRDQLRSQVLRRLAATHLLRFLEAGGFEAAPAYVEEAFQADMGTWRLHGVIDRIDRTEAGWRIVDYKSGSPLPARGLKRDLQLALYAVAAREVLGIEHPELSLVYLRDGTRVEVQASDALLAEARQVGGEIAARVAEGDFEPQPERRRCRRCPYRLACDASL